MTYNGVNYKIKETMSHPFGYNVVATNKKPEDEKTWLS